MIEHNGIQCSAEQKARAEAAEALLPQGTILGITFPVQNLVELWQPQNYYRQAESQLTWIEFETGGTLERIEANSHPDATLYYKAILVTNLGLKIVMTFQSTLWDVSISSGHEVADMFISVYKDMFYCAACDTISNDRALHAHDIAPKGVCCKTPGLWRLTGEQCNEIAVILECLTYRPAKEWAKALNTKAAEQILQMEG